MSLKAGFRRILRHELSANAQGEDAASLSVVYRADRHGEWLKGKLRGPLGTLDLTMGQFRLLELVYREGIVRLTATGKKFIGRVLPNHSKLVKSMFRVLDMREQESLMRLCRKLREGDVVKFLKEITVEREGE
jgi:hypothetical protein